MIGKLFCTAVVEHGNSAALSQGQALVDSVWFGCRDYEIKAWIRQLLISPVYINRPILIHLGLGNRSGQSGNQEMEVGGIQAWRVAVFSTLGIRRISFIVTFGGFAPVLCDRVPHGREEGDVIFSPVFVLVKGRMPKYLLGGDKFNLL